MTEIPREGQSNRDNDVSDQGNPRSTDASGSMPIGELLTRLKPYPIIQSVIIDTMTDQEWEAYVTQPHMSSADIK